VSFSGHFCVDGKIMQIRESIQNWKGLQNAINIPGSITFHFESWKYVFLSRLDDIVKYMPHCARKLERFQMSEIFQRVQLEFKKILIWKKGVKFQMSKMA
jgi:hypothetical protein